MIDDILYGKINCDEKENDLCEAVMKILRSRADNPPAPATRVRRRNGEWKAVRNDWSPTDIGFVGMK